MSTGVADELLKQAYQAFDVGDYEAARAIFQDVAQTVNADSPQGTKANEYLLHLQPDNLAVLLVLADAIEPQDRHRLLNQARINGLRFDLEQTPLDELEAMIEVPVVEGQPEVWLVEAGEAFSQGNYDQARERYGRLAMVWENSQIKEEADLFLLHLQPDNLDLLQKLASASHWKQQQALIETAEARGLSLDLAQQPLAELKRHIETQISIEADGQARAVLQKGEIAADAGELDTAYQQYQTASQIPALSDEMQALIAHKLVEIQHQKEAYAQAGELLDAARQWMQGEGPDYELALGKIETARTIFAAHPAILDLQEQAQTGQARITAVQQMLELAEKSLIDNPEQALVHFRTAWDTAETYDFARLLEVANQGITRAQQSPNNGVGPS